MRQEQRGFSMIEVVLTIVFFMMLIIAGTGAVGPWVNFKQRHDTIRKIEEAKKGLLMMYQTSSFYVDGYSFYVDGTVYGDAIHILNNSGLHEISTPLNNGTICPATIEEIRNNLPLKYLASYMSSSLDESMTDGYKNLFCIVVSPPLVKQIDGSNLIYHVITLISKGGNRELDAEYAADPVTGMINLEGDDLATYINGLDVQEQNYRSVVKKVEKIASAYQEYFHAMYLADSLRSTAKDYFYREVSSGGFSVPANSGISKDAFDCNAVDFQELGVSESDCLDPWIAGNGDTIPNRIWITSTSSTNRSPANADPAMKIAPWTASVSSFLPGGSRVTRTVMGLY